MECDFCFVWFVGGGWVVNFVCLWVLGVCFGLVLGKGWLVDIDFGVWVENCLNLLGFKVKSLLGVLMGFFDVY